MRTLFSLRSYLRCLTPAQRRNWFEQKKRLSPRVPIGNAVIPHGIKRQYSYVSLQ